MTSRPIRTDADHVEIICDTGHESNLLNKKSFRTVLLTALKSTISRRALLLHVFYDVVIGYKKL
jgi:hypothetical protein